jgi:hypothetical protein
VPLLIVHPQRRQSNKWSQMRQIRLRKTQHWCASGAKVTIVPPRKHPLERDFLAPTASFEASPEAGLAAPILR